MSSKRHKNRTLVTFGSPLGLVLSIATWLLLIQTPYLFSVALAEDGLDHQHGSHEADQGDVLSGHAKVKSPVNGEFQGRFLGFGRFRTPMQTICDALEFDGRVERFLDIVAAQAKVLDGCRYCREFYKSWLSACKKVKLKVPLKKKAAHASAAENPETPPAEGGEPTASPSPSPTPILRQPARLPHPEIFQGLQFMFKEFLEDERRKKPCFEAVSSLSRALAEIKDFSVGEKEYFDYFRSYLDTPFKDLAKKIAEESPLASPTPSVSVEDLFER